jgi:PPOX class probable F420-dependent enzyme
VPDNVAKKLRRLMFRGMDKMRHRGAFDVAAMTPTGTGFTGFDKTRQIVLVTFKRSGEAMPSPIYHGVADGKLYVRTDASTGKVKRLRNNPRVVVVPCTLRGKPKGQAVAGTAQILPESEYARVDRVIAANWSPPIKVFERGLARGAEVFDIPAAYIEITPAT